MVERKQASASRFTSLLRLFKWQNHFSSASAIQYCHSTEEKDSNADDKTKSDDIPSLFQGKRSVRLCYWGLAEYKTADAVWISAHTAPSKTRQSLVEFPGGAPTFFSANSASVCRKMSRKLSLPFAEIVAPDSQTSVAVVKTSSIREPKEDSVSTLTFLAGVPLTLKPGQAFDFTKLDGGSHARRSPTVRRHPSSQYRASSHPRARQVQERVYTGVAIIKALLHNRKAADLGPIICVCLHESCSRPVVRAFSEGWREASHPL